MVSAIIKREIDAVMAASVVAQGDLKHLRGTPCSHPSVMDGIEPLSV
jgi:hypothetical protein